MAKGYNIEVRKRDKYNRILNIIRNNDDISRSQIKNISKYSMVTVLSAIDELLKQELIMENGIGESSGGRRPIWLTINPDGGYFIGIEFYSIRICGVIVNFAGDKIYEDAKNIKKQSSANVLKTIKSMIEEMLEFLGKGKDKVLGIGMGVPGQINKQAGVSLGYEHIRDWQNVRIKDELEEEFNIPVYIENNAKVMALAHKWLGQKYDTQDFLFICIRSGISMASMLNGQLHLGMNNNAGEIAHFALLNSSRHCYCGKVGCLEMEASNNAILSKVEERMKVGRFASLRDKMDGDDFNLEMEDFVQSIREGSLDGLELLEETSMHLGYVLAAAINILNPNRIFIWGDITGVGNIFLDMLKNYIDKYALPLNLENISIEYSPWGQDLGAIGAAALIMQEEFDFSAELI